MVATHGAIVFFFTYWLGGFYWFGGLNNLSLSPHVPLLCFFRSRENVSDILGADDWPREIIPFSYGFDPLVFC